MKMPTLEDASNLFLSALRECDGQMHAAEWELNEYTLYEFRRDHRGYSYLDPGTCTLMGRPVKIVRASLPEAPCYTSEAGDPVRMAPSDPRKVGHLALRVQQHDGGRWKYYDWEHNEDWMKV